jgi:hypothetical protein
MHIYRKLNYDTGHVQDHGMLHPIIYPGAAELMVGVQAEKLPTGCRLTVCPKAPLFYAAVS